MPSWSGTFFQSYIPPPKPIDDIRRPVLGNAWNRGIADLPDCAQSYFLRREAPAIHRLQTIDFMGSSELSTVLMTCIAFGHPSHPGNSNTQSSWLKGGS